MVETKYFTSENILLDEEHMRQYIQMKIIEFVNEGKSVNDIFDFFLNDEDWLGEEWIKESIITLILGNL